MSDTEMYDSYEAPENSEDDYLLSQLRQHGLNPGPITDTTRPIYQKVLDNILRTGRAFSETHKNDEAEDESQYLYTKATNEFETELKHRAFTEGPSDLDLSSTHRYDFGTDYLPSATSELSYHRRVLNDQLRHDPLFSAPLGATTSQRSYSSSRLSGNTAREIGMKQQKRSPLFVFFLTVGLIVLGIVLFFVFFVE